jgi:hypothetical protein
MLHRALKKVNCFNTIDFPGCTGDSESNWLPAPDGPIYLVLRMYWPKPASEASPVLPPGKGSWGPPPVKQAD